MVVCSADHGLQADVIFAIEGTAVNGAYINDLKSNYILPSLEYFSQGNLDEVNYMSENANCLYGIVIYYAADCLPNPSSDTIGPFSSPGKLLNALDKLELIGGKGESHANIAEGVATALQCFEELQQKRDPSTSVQKHCILVCNSPPYLLPVMESQNFSGKTTEQLAAVLQERGINLSVISPRKIPSLYKLFEKAGGDLSASQTKNYAKDPRHLVLLMTQMTELIRGINLSVISPRKIPSLYKLFEKAGGDLSASQTKNYAKDPRHLVLLKGYSLKERPISPPGGAVTSSQNQLVNANIPITSLPSPLANSDSPIPGGPAQVNQNLLGPNQNAGQGAVGQNTVYRQNNPQGISQLPQHSQGMGTGMVNVNIVNSVRPNLMANQQFPNQQIPGPPGYHASTVMGNRPTRWVIPSQPQQRPQYNTQPGVMNATQGSALIAQLTQPPSSMPSPVNVNQFSQMGNNPQLRNMMPQQQQPPQGSMAQNPGTPGMQTSNPNQNLPNQAITSQAPGQNQPTPQMNPGRQTIWNGLLEWIEKPKIPTDPQKVTKHVPCSVSANAKDGEPELKADGWPSKLIMQLMPKQLIGNIGGAYLKNSKSVLFHPTPCEALESLTKVMSSGFAGCVHFTSIPNPSACDIKVLILLYTAEKRAYLGFIPNDQAAFVDRLRKVIQQQKSTQMMRQTGPNINPQTGAPIGGPSQMPVSNTSTSQAAQPQGLMMSQTNTMAMGGGQITQNVVTSSGQPGQGLGGQGLLGQNVPGSTMQQRLRMPGMQQTGTQLQNQPQQQPGGNPNMPNPAASGGNMMGGPAGVQRPGQPFANQLEVERQANLDKINQLKQTLQAAQQQEQQYKNQLERISHMKTAQLQEALQLAQQQEMQYKMLDQQQRLGNQGNPQAPNQAQRMMRPVMSNNPGLRTLLQQQPQYRQQLMGLHQMGASQPRPQMGQQLQGAGGNQQVNFDDCPNFDFM